MYVMLLNYYYATEEEISGSGRDASGDDGGKGDTNAPRTYTGLLRGALPPPPSRESWFRGVGRETWLLFFFHIKYLLPEVFTFFFFFIITYAKTCQWIIIIILIILYSSRFLFFVHGIIVHRYLLLYYYISRYTPPDPVVKLKNNNMMPHWTTLLIYISRARRPVEHISATHTSTIICLCQSFYGWHLIFLTFVFTQY